MKLLKILAAGFICIALAGCTEEKGDGLVIHSDFEKDASDSSGNHYDGVLKSGATISEDCVVGMSSVHFNGARSYVEYPAGNVYFDGDYSISIWLKWEDNRSWSPVLDFNQVLPLAGDAVSLHLGKISDGKKELWLDQMTTYNDIVVSSVLDREAVPSQASLGIDIKEGQWNHYVIVYDSSARNPLGKQKNLKGETVPFKGKVTFYLDGEKVSENYYCCEPQAVPTVSNRLGRNCYRGDPGFKGWMDDFRLYNRCITESEIKDLYNMGIL